MAEVSPKVVLPALLLVAVGAAWLVMPSADTGPDVTASKVVKPPPRDPFAALPSDDDGTAPGWVAAEPPPPEVAAALKKYKRDGLRKDRPWEEMRTKLKGMQRMQAANAAAVSGGGRKTLLRARAENHLANAGGSARASVDAWLDDADYPDKVRDQVDGLMDGLEDNLDKIDRALADGEIEPDMAMRKAEMVQESTLRKMEKLTEGDVPEGVAKNFSTPPVPKPAPTVPADAEVPPDGWWEGEPLNWE